MGMLLRLLILGVVAWAVYRMLQRFLLANRAENTPPHTSHQNNAPGNGQVMRRCAWCKVHIPEGESTQSRGEYFCSEAHRDAFLRGPSR